ncbi:ATP-grasp domain-containing protein [Chitinophaga lutea]|uniref:ATP-grasp domain-containing protein n=1 Tax=Chitinophaga lutea TaxID=2488634 RepID=A0A3N4PWY2_9BACT|nr:ATP-grasp domain-containing protein [Chitinophaga lutea]RPE13232.1 ATP-grasp domain-containing protein [Chitinophaga lutea]
MNQIKVLVTGVGGGGLGEQTLKALKLSKLPLDIIAADVTPISKGLSQVKRAFIVPPASSSNYINEVLSICAAEKVNVLFCGSEAELKKLSKHRQQIIDAGIFFPINNDKVIATCLDKFKTAEFFRENNIPYPKTYKITCLSDIDQIGTFPLVLKPNTGAGGSANTMIVQSKDELFAFVKYLLGFYNEFVAQEYVGDPESEYTVGVLSDMNGKLINSIAINRFISSGLGNRIKVKNTSGRSELGEHLIISSGISQGEIGRFPLVTKQCEEIAQKIGSTGPLNIQCRLVNGKVYIFEINPRYSGTSSMRAMVGFNEPDLMIRHHYLNEPIKRNFEYDEGYVIRGLDEEYLPKKDK